MGKLDRIRKRVETFAVLFWALGNVQTKEYLLAIEGSVPPVVVRRKHSPNLSLPALSAVIQTERYCKILQTERREVGRVLPMDNKGDD